MKRWLKIALAIPAFLILAFTAFALTHSGLGIDRNSPPKFITHEFTDLSRIYSISKFRSAAGHDFSGGGEHCRSMKHYFDPQRTAEDDAYTSSHQGIPQPPDGQTDIPIYSPVDGTIVAIEEEHTPIGRQISIIPKDASQFAIRLFHVFPKDGLGTPGPLAPFGIGGVEVKSGQQIGVLGAHQGTDISVQAGTMPWNENFISYFDVMPDSIFASSYQSRGVKDRSDLILTQQYRDAHPLQCGGPQKDGFVYPEGYDSEATDYFHLSGYIAPPSHSQGPQPKSQPQ